MQTRNHDGFETLAIHAGQEPDPHDWCRRPADLPGLHLQAGRCRRAARAGYEYSRTANPTRRALEECLVALEGGTQALAFASGMAAEDALLRTACAPGDHVLIPHDAYGGTYRLIDKVLQPWGRELPAGSGIRPGRRPRGAGEQARAAGLGGDTHQPAAVDRRHQRAGADRARQRRAAGGGQHLRLAVPAAAAGARRGRGRALHDQVPRRALRRGGRRAGGRGRRARASGSPSTRTPPERLPGHSTPG